jgi:NADH-quinone oxidoreductase subunit C
MAEGALSARQIIDLLAERFGGALLAAHAEGKHPRVHLAAEQWRPVAEFLRRDERLRFDWLANLSGVDYPAEGKLAVAYDLWSYALRHRFAVKVFCARENPRVATVSDLWRAADWHEREAYDMFGIVFEGHPDPRRILLPEDWVGFPLRKDYVFPTEYGGIPAESPDAAKR